MTSGSEDGIRGRGRGFGDDRLGGSTSPGYVDSGCFPAGRHASPARLPLHPIPRGRGLLCTLLDHHLAVLVFRQPMCDVSVPGFGARLLESSNQ
jgi:hypothetical protein